MTQKTVMRRPGGVLCILLVLLVWLVTHRQNLADPTRAHLQQTTPTLVMVPGHGIYVNGEWRVASFLQRFVPGMNAQIREAARRVRRNPRALAVFSGGYTHLDLGPISEGSTYIQAGVANGDISPESMSRCVAEEFARDSFENLLFSLCRFKQHTGEYPHEVVVVGFEFKRERFVNEHRRAIRFPKHRFAYIGIPKGEFPEQVNMERAGTIPQFHQDPYGCMPPLSTKKHERNPFQRDASVYLDACPELAGLFRACGRDVFVGPLPWDP